MQVSGFTRSRARRVAATLTVSAASVTLLAQAQINGAGATFPYPIYSKWFSEYNKLQPDVRSTTSRSAPAAASAGHATRRCSSAPPTAR